MNMSEILRILDKHSFVVDKSEMFIQNHEEFVYCYNERLNVGFVIKEYFEYTKSEVMEDVVKVRTILRNVNINIWNSYFIVLVNSTLIDQTNRKIYNIERNSKGLRKYVVVSENDLYRIPFIKINETSSTFNIIADFEKILLTEDKEVNELIDWVIKEDGEFLEFKKALLKGKINEIFFMENEK